MAEIARILGEKRMCRMEVDYLGLQLLDIFCVEHELVLTALTSIQSMVRKSLKKLILILIPYSQKSFAFVG